LEEQQRQRFKESLLEIFYIIKACFSSFWFWLPPLFAVYMYLELYLLCVSPLLVLIGPIITIIYALFWEEKRIKAQYDIKDLKAMRSSDPMFSMPHNATNKKQIEELVEEYKRMIKNRTEKSDDFAEEN
jgi:hypothetical protein